MTLAVVLALAAPPRFPNAQVLFAAVDRKLGSWSRYRCESVTVSPFGRSHTRPAVLRGGYGMQEEGDTVYIQNPSGGWIVHKGPKTYERLKRGELTIDPFLSRPGG